MPAADGRPTARTVVSTARPADDIERRRTRDSRWRPAVSGRCTRPPSTHSPRPCSRPCGPRAGESRARPLRRRRRCSPSCSPTRSGSTGRVVAVESSRAGRRRRQAQPGRPAAGEVTALAGDRRSRWPRSSRPTSSSWTRRVPAPASRRCDDPRAARDGRSATSPATRRRWPETSGRPWTRGWRLAELRAFDAFPMTAHIECIALLLPGNESINPVLRSRLAGSLTGRLTQ